MQNTAGVIVDTSVWVDYLRGRNSGRATPLAELINQRQAILCGIVLAEILNGVRSPQERLHLNDLLNALPYRETSRHTWLRAGELAHSLRSQGFPTPLSDLILAALALEHRCALLTYDRHFHRIPRLPLYQPA
ncbi:MAG: PIN domain-containing protein [Chloroflexi bacterium]|nr:PIN domain-containing protein [Chloroflexota bacterium]